MDNPKAKKTLLTVLTVILLAQIACGTVEKLIKKAALPLENDTAELSQEEPSQEPDTPTPTEEIVPTKTPEPTLTRTPKPTEPTLQRPSSGKLLYFTDFDSEVDLSNEWSVFSDPSELDYEYSLEDSHLFIGIADPQSIVMMLNIASLEDGLEEDVYIEAGFENLSGHDVNHISLVCRFSFEGWYEFRLMEDGEWEIWKFADSSDGYVRLDDDRAPRLTVDTPGTIGALCSGDTLTLYFNGQPVQDATVTDSELTEGMAGLSVFTLLWEQAAIEFDYFGVQVP